MGAAELEAGDGWPPASMELSQLRLRKPAVAGGSWSGGPQFISPNPPSPEFRKRSAARSNRGQSTVPGANEDAEFRAHREGKNAARACGAVTGGE